MRTATVLKRLPKRPGRAAAMALAGLGIVLAVICWAYFSPQRSEVRAQATGRPDLPGLAAPDLAAPSLSLEDALALNAALPFVSDGIENPPSFFGFDAAHSALSYNAALDCLTQAIYYESAGETVQGQRAVAQVVLNRVRHPAYPSSICEVVYQGSGRATGCQFTFTCDGSLARRPGRAAWDNARRIAAAALSGAIEPTVGMATHYHANWVAPYWAPELDKLVAIGAHIFYRWKGYWGQRRAFNQSYSGELGLGLPELTLSADLMLPLDNAVPDRPVVALSADQSGLGLPSPRIREPAGLALPPIDQGGRLVADERRPTLFADEGRALLDAGRGVPAEH